LISSETEYQKAREELEHLTAWLARLENREVTERKGLTGASVRRVIARVQDEIAQYEAAHASAAPDSAERAEPDEPGAQRRAKGQD
jgi:hypothetical protein